MIEFTEAKRLMEAQIKALSPVNLPLISACGSVLAERVSARYDSPPFGRSAMDGFAINSCDTSRKIGGVIRAGELPAPLSSGECARIMTGAKVPAGCDTVIPKEDASETNGMLEMTKPYKKGQFIRYKGSEIRAGGTLMDKGTLVTPAGAALLASQGYIEVNVHRRPSAAVITTGDEIVRPGSPRDLKETEIFDSNYYAISTRLNSFGIELKDMGIAKDEPLTLMCRFKEALSNDIVLVSGGISVGDFDHARNIFKEAGVLEVFWRVAQKPGKPLYFGVSEKGSLVFGLPGNPAAVIVCMNEYVIPAIKKMMGYASIWPTEITARLSSAIGSERDRMEFVRGIYASDAVEPIPDTESYMLKGFSLANCLILAEKGKRYENGDDVTVHLL